MSDKKVKTQQKMDYQLIGASRYGLDEARRLYDDKTPLPSAYVPISAQRREGLGRIETMARAGGGVGPTTTAEYLRTMRGDYLHPESNPYLRANVATATREAAAAPASLYAAGGRFTSGGLLQAANDAASRTAERMYGDNYAREREMMASYLGMAPTAADMETLDPTRLAAVGEQYEADQAAQVEEQLRQYFWPREQLAQYEASLGASPLAGAGSTVVSQPFDWMAAISGMLNPAASMMG